MVGSDWQAVQNIQLQHLDPEAGTGEAGCWASGQSGMTLPRARKPVFFQQTNCSAPEGFTLGNGKLWGMVEIREHEISSSGGLSVMSPKKGRFDTW